MSFDPLSSVVTALKREQLIPDVLPESFYPSGLFTIIFPSGKEVTIGEEVPLEDTGDEPDIVFTPMGVPDANTGEIQAGAAAQEATYTLVMLDPDAPSRDDPKFKSFRHWVITGLKAPAATSASTKNMAALKMKTATTPYRPPGPRPGSGLHRYTFFLFQEPVADAFAVPEGAPEYGAALEERRSWDGVAFGEKYGLKLVAANFFLVRSAPAET
ncbi:phosphatidylethanolamine-binding protein [Schizophyllum amplum]|uniref:Phosphatidylethanolamine-binding protein n=1 Tax=Schizophyllum amplum TaxID=97359 RepID=A0A550CBN8_9AGAR|nr:phosphatidylethanolamine-binding protein [Auriculariopsis ampla]